MLTAVLKAVKDAVIRTQGPCVAVPQRPATHRLISVTHNSTSGYGVFLGDKTMSWSSKHQHIVSRSSAKAEYHAVANGVAEAYWLRQLLLELHSPLHRATVVYYDNISDVYLSTNPVQHQPCPALGVSKILTLIERMTLGDEAIFWVYFSHNAIPT
jgi:hypothetical protein